MKNNYTIYTHPIFSSGREYHQWELFDCQHTINCNKDYTMKTGAIKAAKRYAVKHNMKATINE